MRGLTFKKQMTRILAITLGLQSFAFTLIPASGLTSRTRHEVDPGFSAARSLPAASNPRYGCGEVDQQSKEDAAAQRKIAEADRLDNEAEKERRDASDARGRANQRRELAAAARKRADKASDPKDKQSWMDTAAQHEQEAQRL